MHRPAACPSPAVPALCRSLLPSSLLTSELSSFHNFLRRSPSTAFHTSPRSISADGHRRSGNPCCAGPRFPLPQYGQMLSVSSSLLQLILFLLITQIGVSAEKEQSFYDLLGVSRDADLLSVRKAFKRLAIQKHPDKNPDDPTAHSTFVRINRAYEVLKDEELRRKYDQFGEKGLEQGGGAGEQYQSWQFYRDNFGIYDDDYPEVVTLSRSDFHEEVFQSGELWFVNFYSTYCSHCHVLAPVWREFARLVPEGIARIGAVNCAEDPALCQSQRVHGYPSLVLFPRGEWFQGSRETDALMQFLLSNLAVLILRPSVGLPPERPLLLEFCEGEDCLSEEDRRKGAAIAANLGFPFAVLECAGEAGQLCRRLGHRDGLFLFPSRAGADEPKELLFADMTDLRSQLLLELPQLGQLDQAELDWLLQRAPDPDGEETLALLLDSDFSASADPPSAEWRRLALLFPDLQVRLVHCRSLACGPLHAGQLPRPVLFRPSGGFDMLYGNTGALDVRQTAKFVRQSRQSQLVVLDADSYWSVRESGALWLIDHFAPWCPPCLQLLRELRQLPRQMLGRTLHVGSLDCDAHRDICQREGVTSYPRSVLFTGDGLQHQLVGFHPRHELQEFVSECLSPSVEQLDPDSFAQRVSRPEGALIFVDFFAPWCGPCQQLAPEFRRLARHWAQASPDSPLSFGAVDCDRHGQLCHREGVHSYPTLRLYRHSPRMGAHDYPANWWRNSQTMAHWLAEMMPSLVHKLAGDFPNTVLESADPFLVDFYAPWCSHCVQFAPTFERLAKLLEGEVRLGKLDCDRFGHICRLVGMNAYPWVALYWGTEGKGAVRQNAVGVPVEHEQDAERIADRVRQLLAQRRSRGRDEL